MTEYQAELEERIMLHQQALEELHDLQTHKEELARHVEKLVEELGRGPLQPVVQRIALFPPFLIITVALHCILPTIPVLKRL